MSRDAGFIFMLQERRPWRQPETEEDYKKVLGYVPTEDENGVFSLWGRVCAYTRQLQAEFAKAIEERHGIK